MFNQQKKIIGMLVGVIYFYSVPLSASPGAPGEGAVLEEKEIDAFLYLTGIVVSENFELQGVELAWIPESVKSQCLGKKEEACRQVWHEKALQRHNQHLKSEKENLSYSFGTDDKYPPEVLTEWISKNDLDQNNKNVFRQISQLKVVKDSYQSIRGTEKILISEDKKIKVAIRYFHLTNGESFQAVRVLEK